MLSTSDSSGQGVQLQHSHSLPPPSCPSSCPRNAPVRGRAVPVTPVPVCGPGDHVLAIDCLMLGSRPTSMQGLWTGDMPPPLLMFGFLANPDLWNQWGQ